MIKATERGFDLNIRREFAPLRLGKPFQHSRQMRRIEFMPSRPSPPRKRGSRASARRHAPWVPAFAGTTKR